MKESSSLVCQAVIRETSEGEEEREGEERDEEVTDSAQHRAQFCYISEGLMKKV